MDHVFTLRDTGSATVSTCLTSATATLAHYNDFTVSNGTFNAQLPARSIRTFVLN